MPSDSALSGPDIATGLAGQLAGTLFCKQEIDHAWALRTLKTLGSFRLLAPGDLLRQLVRACPHAALLPRLLSLSASLQPRAPWTPGQLVSAVGGPRPFAHALFLLWHDSTSTHSPSTSDPTTVAFPAIICDLILSDGPPADPEPAGVGGCANPPPRSEALTELLRLAWDHDTCTSWDDAAFGPRPQECCPLRLYDDLLWSACRVSSIDPAAATRWMMQHLRSVFGPCPFPLASAFPSSTVPYVPPPAGLLAAAASAAAPRALATLGAPLLVGLCYSWLLEHQQQQQLRDGQHPGAAAAPAAVGVLLAAVAWQGGEAERQAWRLLGAAARQALADLGPGGGGGEARAGAAGGGLTLEWVLQTAQQVCVGVNGSGGSDGGGREGRSGGGGEGAGEQLGEERQLACWEASVLAEVRGALQAQQLSGGRNDVVTGVSRALGPLVRSAPAAVLQRLQQLLKDMAALQPVANGRRVDGPEWAALSEVQALTHQALQRRQQQQGQQQQQQQQGQQSDPAAKAAAAAALEKALRSWEAKGSEALRAISSFAGKGPFQANVKPLLLSANVALVDRERAVRHWRYVQALTTTGLVSNTEAEAFAHGLKAFGVVLDNSRTAAAAGGGAEAGAGSSGADGQPFLVQLFGKLAEAASQQTGVVRAISEVLETELKAQLQQHQQRQQQQHQQHQHQHQHQLQQQQQQPRQQQAEFSPDDVCRLAVEAAVQAERIVQAAAQGQGHVGPRDRTEQQRAQQLLAWRLQLVAMLQRHRVLHAPLMHRLRAAVFGSEGPGERNGGAAGHAEQGRQRQPRGPRHSGGAAAAAAGLLACAAAVMLPKPWQQRYSGGGGDAPVSSEAGGAVRLQDLAPPAQPLFAWHLPGQPAPPGAPGPGGGGFCGSSGAPASAFSHQAPGSACEPVPGPLILDSLLSELPRGSLSSLCTSASFLCSYLQQANMFQTVAQGVCWPSYGGGGGGGRAYLPDPSATEPAPLAGYVPHKLLHMLTWLSLRLGAEAAPAPWAPSETFSLQPTAKRPRTEGGPAAGTWGADGRVAAVWGAGGGEAASATEAGADAAAAAALCRSCLALPRVRDVLLRSPGAEAQAGQLLALERAALAAGLPLPAECLEQAAGMVLSSLQRGKHHASNG